MGQGGVLFAHVGTIFVLFSITFNLGNAQADLLAIQIHLNNLSLNLLAQLQSVVGFSNALLSDFGNVNQAFNLVGQFNNSAEGQETSNFNFNNVTNVELASFYLPGILLGSFDGQSNAFVFAVNLLNQYSYFVAFLSNVSSLSGAVPSQLSVVNQANQTSANFYKQTKFSNLNNLTPYLPLLSF